MLVDLGESVSYYANSGSYSYSSSSATDVDGYLIDATAATPTVLNIIIATFTQKDIEMFDVGNLGVDDHKAFIPNSISPAEKDWIVRASDSSEFEVVNVMHEHAVAGNVGFYTVHIRRRRT